MRQLRHRHRQILVSRTHNPQDRKPQVHRISHTRLNGILLKFEVILTVHPRYYVEVKCQLDATGDIYCRFYCLLNMFRAILYPSSGAREYYTDGGYLWYLVL